MTHQLSTINPIENALVKGDLSKLSENQRLDYFKQLCSSLNLNPLTKPFEYMTLNGRLVLYANKGCAEQLRQVHKVSLKITSRETIEGVYIVTAEASLPDGRIDSSTGAVACSHLKGEALANAFMKAETKAKRRVTLSLLGLNMLDETEAESIKEAAVGEVKNVTPPKQGYTTNLQQPSESTQIDADKTELNGQMKNGLTPKSGEIKTLIELQQEARKLANTKGWGAKGFADVAMEMFSKNPKDLTVEDLEALIAFHK